MILAESYFAGVTAQVQCYGRIGMSNAAAVRDVARNGLLNCDGTKKKQKDKKRGLYHGLTKELQITLLMMCIEDAPATISVSDAYWPGIALFFIVTVTIFL